MPNFTIEKRAVVDPRLYSEDYFLTDNEGWQEYISGLDLHVHPKFEKALALANPSKGDVVLDIGCGRGELLYYCAKMGARALGLDYSSAAIKIARQTIQRLPLLLQSLASAEVGEMVDYDFKEKYDIIFMIETLEHMHDWQLVETFERIRGILSDRGALIIITPNYYYEKYLSPLKRILDLPLNLIKLPLRILRGRYTTASFGALVRKAFRIRVDRGEANRMMHVNVATPAKIKRLLHQFDAAVRCEDCSKNVLSLLMMKWWGRDIVAVAKKC